jgi:oxygen-independent coproporphyrinogen-3 oxidase
MDAPAKQAADSAATITRRSFPEPPPLSLYIHLPWCVRKCPYCDFNSHAIGDGVDREGYVDALLADLDIEMARRPDVTLDSVFLGGGTPSLFSGGEIGRLLNGVDRRLGLADDVEITLEANPGTADAGHFSGYRAAGVNRLSIGVQSLDDAQLAGLGRIHRAADAVAAVTMARRAGFDNFNLDMMFGLPGQSLDQAMADLGAALALEPTHLSWYQLTLEPNTAFHHQPPRGMPDDDHAAEIGDAGQERLRAAGLHRYEVSAYALPGRTCRHNRNYWEFGDYFAIGAGAHGKLTLSDGRIERVTRQRSPAAYMAAAAQGAISSRRTLADDELPLEFMLNALRLCDGVSSASFEARSGLPLPVIEGPCRQARDLGLMVDQPGRLAPTALGLAFLNDLLALFES